MTSFSLTLSGQSYSVSTSDPAQLAAITACRTKFNEALPQTIKDGDNDIPNPDLLPDDEAYLNHVFGHWAAANPGFDQAALDAVAASAFASYADQNPPEQVVQQPLEGDALKTALKAYAAARRYAIETGGTTVGGIAIDTTRESQGKLTAAWAKAKSDPAFQINNWKTSQGAFVTLNNATIIVLGDAVLAHVQACFDAEAAAFAGIDDDTITSTAQVDAALVLS